MLDVLRRNAGSWAIKVILTLIAVTFISWGVGTYSSREQDVAATVGKEEISRTELEREAGAMEKVYREVYGAAFTPELARTLNLKEQAVNSLIQRRLMMAEARAMGLTATDTEVRREITSIPAFQEDGSFHEGRYQAILANSRTTPAEFEDAKREEITLRKMEGLFAAAARVSGVEARDAFDLTFRRVRLLVAAADPEKAGGAPAVTEEEIAARYAQSRESYRIPARVRLLVARFDPAAFAPKAEITPREIQSFYEGNTDKFRTEEERLVSRIFLPYAGKDKEGARKKAAAILAESGQSRSAFDNAVRKHSRDASRAVWLTRARAGRDIADIADAVFSAPVDTVAGPAETPKGLLLARVDQIRFPESLPLPQVKDQVVSLLRYEKGKDLAVIKAYEAHGKAVESRALAAACAPYGIEPARTGWLGSEGGDSVPGPVVQDALVLQKGEVGAVRTVGDVHYLFQVTEKEDSRIASLDEVRGRVRAAIAAEKKRNEARATLIKVLAASNTAAELEKNARRAGISVETTPFFAPLSGSLPEPLLSAGDVRRDVASLSPRVRILTKALESKGRFLGAAFVDEQIPDDKEWAAKKDTVVKELAERKKARMMEAFLDGRKKQAGVTINAEALK